MSTTLRANLDRISQCLVSNDQTTPLDNSHFHYIVNKCCILGAHVDYISGIICGLMHDNNVSTKEQILCAIAWDGAVE